MAAPMNDRISGAEENGTTNKTSRPNNRFKEIVLFSGVAGISMIAGFGMAFTRAKKKDPIFAQGALGGKRLESPTALGARALAWGTLISVSGVGLLCFAVYKLTGAKNLKDFKEKVQETTPKLPKKESTGRNEFSSIKDLVDYCIKGGKG